MLLCDLMPTLALKHLWQNFAVRVRFWVEICFETLKQTQATPQNVCSQGFFNWHTTALTDMLVVRIICYSPVYINLCATEVKLFLWVDILFTAAEMWRKHCQILHKNVVKLLTPSDHRATQIQTYTLLWLKYALCKDYAIFNIKCVCICLTYSFQWFKSAQSFYISMWHGINIGEINQPASWTAAFSSMRPLHCVN